MNFRNCCHFLQKIDDSTVKCINGALVMGYITDDSKRGMLDSSFFCVSELFNSCKDWHFRSTSVRPWFHYDVYSWFQCCVYTLIFRHDSTVMIPPSWFDREVTKRYSILPWISYRNQSTQSKSYFNDSLNVSLVIRKKRTVIHNLFSFSDNSL